MEEWRKVPGFGYEISIATKEGRCRNMKTGRLLSNNPDKRGRIYWCLFKNSKGSTRQAAVWIALTFPELIQNEYFEGAEIDHIDTDRTNSQPSNLRWVTRKENANNPLTRLHNSEAKKGEKAPWFGKKLSEEHIRKLKEARAKRGPR